MFYYISTPNKCNLLTSTGTKSALSSPNSLAISLPFEVSKSHNTTLPPCWTKRCTVAFPKPEAAPVTKETDPCQINRFNNSTDKL